MRMHIALTAAIAVLLCAGCGGGSSSRSEGPDRIACTITDDFETNELYAWESYPYAEDIGYDPMLTGQKEPAHNDSKYALARIVKPNDALDLSQGFTKQIDLWTTEDTALDFALFLMSDRKPEWVEVSLGTFDGRLFTKTLEAPAVNRWLDTDIPRSEFTLNGSALEPGEHVQVIAIKAWYPLVTHLMSYTILIDDVSLNGERQRTFTAVEPASTRFDHFGSTILNRHYYTGESFGISVSPEGDRKVGSVTGTMLDAAGSAIVSDVALFDDGSHGDTKSGDNVWTNSDMYTFSENDGRGKWTLQLAGTSDSGPSVVSEITFLVPGVRLGPDDHPRLFFSDSEMRARLASSEPAHVKKILTNALAQRDRYANADIDEIDEDTNVPSESLTGGPYSRVSSDGRRWQIPAYTLAGIAEHGAWQYYFKGDEEAGARAKKALLKFCGFTMWNRSWMEAHGRHIYFPVGYMTRRVAIAYDLLYPILTEEERKAVRDGIMNNAIKPFYRDMVEMNRMPSSLSNHIAVIVAGLGLAATTIYGDDADNPYLEPYLSGIMTKMKDFMDKTYMPGGSYGEPYTYQAMASRDLTETLFAFERNFGVDFTTETDIKDAWIYPLYVTDPIGLYQDFGDVSHWYGMTQTHMQWLTYRMRNPWTYAYMKPFYEKGGGGYTGYIWYTDGIEPRYRSELPTSRLFDLKGNMVMRSGWDDESSIMIFKCGPNSNHYHLDQGTFVIMTNGSELLSDAGHSSNYYANLYYPCYYTQPIGHNVMLVDMNPESQSIADYENGVAALRDYPHIIHHFAGDIADEVEGDLTCVYKDQLTGYTRSLLYMKPDIVFLFDRVEGNGSHEYNWLFHAEHTNGERSITWKDGSMTITRPDASLTMNVVAPEIASAGIRDSDRDESFLTLSSKPDLPETAFLAALIPEAGSGKPKPVETTRIESDGWLGAKVAYKGETTTALFRMADGAGTKTPVDGVISDASRVAFTTGRNGSLSRLFIVDGRNAEYGAKERIALRSDREISAAVSYEGSVTTLEADSTGETSVSVTVKHKPRTVTVNGTANDSWQYYSQDGTLMIKVPEGKSVIVMQ